MPNVYPPESPSMSMSSWKALTGSLLFFFWLQSDEDVTLSSSSSTRPLLTPADALPSSVTWFVSISMGSSDREGDLGDGCLSLNSDL